MTDEFVSLPRKDLQEVVDLLRDIRDRATRHQRATEEKKYLLWDLEHIEEKTEKAREKLRRMLSENLIERISGLE